MVKAAAGNNHSTRLGTKRGLLLTGVEGLPKKYMASKCANVSTRTFATWLGVGSTTVAQSRNPMVEFAVATILTTSAGSASLVGKVARLRIEKRARWATSAVQRASQQYYFKDIHSSFSCAVLTQRNNR